MTPDQLDRARKRLGLTLEQMAIELGYEGAQYKYQVHHVETGRREIRPALVGSSRLPERLPAPRLAG